MSAPTSKDIVENAIAEGQVVIFSKSWCSYSQRAKALIKDKYSDAKLIILELDEREDGNALQTYLQEKTGQRTVPNVFIKQKHVGGCDDLLALDKIDGIEKLLD
ncbi:glutaredoxin [Lactarius indigo]|nr:glutaredoxin [Lactarius indigo]KAI9444733.1 glutaredoxin [Lactarius indigo]